MKPITVTYRFHPKYLWEPFRWEFADGSNAHEFVMQEMIRSARRQGLWID